MLAEVAQGGPGWWQVWGSSVLPVLGSLVVSVVALAGVVWSTRKQARATIEAEDKRAAAAIAAEDRRHEHALEAERMHRMAETRHALYVGLFVGCQSIKNRLGALRPFLGAEYFVSDNEQLRTAVGHLSEAIAAMYKPVLDATLFASGEVDEALNKAIGAAFQVERRFEEVLKTRLPNEAVSLDEAIEDSRKAFDGVESQMRAELGSE